MNNHYAFPLKCTSIIGLKSNNNITDEQQKTDDSTILLEKRLLKLVNRAFIGELSYYALFCVTASYAGVGFSMGNLNFKILTAGLLVPGAILSGGTHYLRHYSV